MDKTEQDLIKRTNSTSLMVIALSSTIFAYYYSKKYNFKHPKKFTFFIFTSTLLLFTKIIIDDKAMKEFIDYRHRKNHKN